LKKKRKIALGEAAVKGARPKERGRRRNSLYLNPLPKGGEKKKKEFSEERKRGALRAILLLLGGKGAIPQWKRQGPSEAGGERKEKEGYSSLKGKKKRFFKQQKRGKPTSDRKKKTP